MTQEELKQYLEEIYFPDCDCSHDQEAPDLADSTEAEDMAFRMVMDIWKAKRMPDNISEEMTAFFASKLMQGVEKGYGAEMTSFDFDTPDFVMLGKMKDSVFHFSAAKNYQQQRALSQALLNSDGKLRTWNEFKEAAYQINQDHVGRWLKSEYQFALGAGQMAATWSRITEGKEELPLLQFDSVNDDRRTPVCKDLDGVIKPVDDDFWAIYYPPNHWGCRSDVKQLAHGKITPTEQIITPEKMPEMFKTNLAKSGLAFPADHPYFKALPERVKEKAQQMANTFEPARSLQEAQEWAKKNLKAKIEDWKGVSTDLANTLNQTLQELESKAPSIEPVNIKFTGVTGKAYMQYDWHSNTIHLRKSYHDIETRLEADNKTWKKLYKEKYSVSDNVSDLIRHEFGHHVDNMTKRAILKGVEALELPEKNQAYGISGYAATDRFYTDKAAGSEMVAEVLCSYFKGDPSFKKLPASVQSIITKIFEP